MNLRIYLHILILFCSTKVLFGQDDYQKWMNEQKKEYNQFISRQDKEFIEFLKKDWKSIDIKEGIKSFQKPKFPEPVTYSPSTSSNEPIEIPVSIIPEKIIIDPQRKKKSFPSDSPVETTKEPVDRSLIHQLNYFNSELLVVYNETLNISLTEPVSKESVAEYWKKLSGTNYLISLKRASNLRNKLKLNDWGYCKLLFDIGKQIDQNKRNESYLFTWFMLIKSGFMARVGYEQNKVYLLISTNNRLFDVPYFRFSNQEDKFYVLLFDEEKQPEGEIFTYQDDYPNILHKLSFNFLSVPELGNQLIKKEIDFIYKGKRFLIPFECNKSLIDFYKFYPYTDLDVYFHSEISSESKNELLNNLKPFIDSLNEKDAVNFLLHFVQDATGYKTDKEQFGREKPFFPEESLYYPYSDCEDRAVFFTYLVRSLLNLKVVGLDYPDHVATAVRFNTNVTGDYIDYNNQKYLICDPTYLGASIGKSMPKYQKLKANIIN